jgi:hypothetical protein
MHTQTHTHTYLQYSRMKSIEFILHNTEVSSLMGYYYTKITSYAQVTLGQVFL